MENDLFRSLVLVTSSQIVAGCRAASIVWHDRVASTTWCPTTSSASTYSQARRKWRQMPVNKTGRWGRWLFDLFSQSTGQPSPVSAACPGSITPNGTVFLRTVFFHLQVERKRRPTFFGHVVNRSVEFSALQTLIRFSWTESSSCFPSFFSFLFFLSFFLFNGLRGSTDRVCFGPARLDHCPPLLVEYQCSSPAQIQLLVSCTSRPVDAGPAPLGYSILSPYLYLHTDIVEGGHFNSTLATQVPGWPVSGAIFFFSFFSLTKQSDGWLWRKGWVW